MARKAVHLAPVTPWLVDWTKTSCTLARGFGSKDDLQVLLFEQFGKGQHFQLLITAKALRAIKKAGETTLIYKSEDSDLEFSNHVPRALIGRNSKRVPTLFVSRTDLFGDTPGDARKIEARITQLHVKSGGRTIIFKTGPLDKAFDAMRKCTDDLIQSWGLDLKQINTITRWPIPKTSPSSWLKSSDYPMSARLSGAQALISFRLLVDETGKPTDCLIQRSYSGRLFNKITCERLLRRGRFEPARNNQDQPVAAYYGTNVSWVMRQ